MASRKETWKKLTGVLFGCLILFHGVANPVFEQLDISQHLKNLCNPLNSDRTLAFSNDFYLTTPTIKDQAFGNDLNFSPPQLLTSSTQPQTLFNLMSYQEVLPITITVDMDTIKSYRNSKEDIKATIHFKDKNAELLEWDAKLEIRGRFRRTHCVVPPLKLNFKKSQLRAAGLAAFDDFDLVTHCLHEPDWAKELVMKEYLAYKLYNEITPYSYRVQMIKITFKNLDTGKEDEMWGFLVEDTAELSARINAEKLDTLIISPHDLDESSFNNMFIFQSMIGNVDWGIKPIRNLKLFRREEAFIPIPYDFDFSALVDAPYAKFTVNSFLRSKEQLKLLDNPGWPPPLKTTLSFFQSKREAMLNTIQKATILPLASLDWVVRHIDAYLNQPYRMVIPTQEALLLKEKSEGDEK